MIAFHRTALHWAVKRDHKDIVDVLLHAGAKKDMKNNNGLTPFDLAPSQTSTSAPSSIVESQGRVKFYDCNCNFHEVVVIA